VVSRRRQRELARVRHERRQQQLLERRGRQRRRNAVIGAVVAVLLVIGGVAYAAVALSGGGGSKPTASPPTASPTPAAPAAPTKCATIKPNPPKKGQPTIPDVTGTVSNQLVKKDVKVGTGATAKTGSSLSVTYIGVSCSTGTVFDASYLHGGTPFTVSPLGSAQVITGWNSGLIGARAGGVRELVIPPSQGYGAQGQGSIKPNEVLIFLIDVKSVK
jgi:peptidylprolyl isomerase